MRFSNLFLISTWLQIREQREREQTNLLVQVRDCNHNCIFNINIQNMHISFTLREKERD